MISQCFYYVSLLLVDTMIMIGDLDSRPLRTLRPVHLLRVAILRVLESNFPGDPLSKFMDMKIPPLRIKSLLESNPLKPELLVGGLGVPVSVKR